MITLTKQQSEWTVRYEDDGGVLSNRFPTIERAADYMTTTFGILDDEIDEALCDMALSDIKDASFEDGRYVGRRG